MAALLRSRRDWAGAEGRIRDALDAARADEAGVDEDTLSAVLRLVGSVLPDRWRDASPAQAPPAIIVPGCAEVEWDRVAASGVDLGPYGIRFGIADTVWAAAIGRRRSQPRGASPQQLWARLVDEETGAVHDAVEMRWTAGFHTARGYVPPVARATRTRIEVMADIRLPARDGEHRNRVLAEQRLFRRLLSDRRAGKPRLVSTRDVQAGSPFLAELHLRPADLASASADVVSPGAALAAPRPA
ncbi:hypothetical protein [Phycicoccus sp. Root563]|uniref:hypothetical protein n=1 Tax=Phycicoccus sp. Root563 TaxID=1736562 RepID=UPI0012FA0407|nr:hypothetical protein [Phycicoccus sp. Root563]